MCAVSYRVYLHSDKLFCRTQIKFFDTRQTDFCERVKPQKLVYNGSSALGDQRLNDSVLKTVFLLANQR